MSVSLLRVAAHLNPEILFVDEVLAVGDASFQAKCLNKMGDSARSGRTILFVSHNTNAIERLCDRVVVLDKGGVAGIFDNPREAIGFYLGRGGTMSTIWTNSGSEFRNDYFTPQRIEAKSDCDFAGAPFPQDHPIILTIDGVVNQSDPALQIGLYIYDEAEQIVFTSWSTDSVEKNWPRLDPGPVRLSVTIPPHWLNEGTYRAEFLAAIALRQWLIEPWQFPLRQVFHSGRVERVTLLDETRRRICPGSRMAKIDCDLNPC